LKTQSMLSAKLKEICKTEKRFCYCREMTDSGDMVQCDTCDEWYHFRCLGLPKHSPILECNWICPPCTKTLFRLTSDLKEQRGLVHTLSCQVATELERPGEEASTKKRKVQDVELPSKCGSSSTNKAPDGVSS
jgi:hypothetical protein